MDHPPVIAAARSSLTQSSFLPVIACLALLLALLTNFQTVDLDVFHEMSLARQALRTGTFPYHEFASFTSTVDPVIDHEWLAGFVFYGVAVTTGAAGFMAFKYFLVAGLVVLLTCAARRRGASAVTLCMLAPMAAVVGCMGLGTIRAQVFTLLLTASLLLLLTCASSKHPFRLLLWLPLQLLWINLHGGFVAGLGILVCAIVEHLIRHRRMPAHLLLLLLASFAIIPINPYGLAYLPFLWRSLTLNRPLIMEWQPIWTGPALLISFFILSLLVPVYALLKLRWPRLDGILLLGVTATLATLHARHAALYAIVWIAYVPAWIQQTPLATEFITLGNRRPHMVKLCALVITLGALAVALPRHPWQLAIPTSPDPDYPTAVVYPAGAVDYLRGQHFRGNVMTPFEVGAFVSWKLFPEVKIGLDSRYEVAYDPAFVLAVHRMYVAAPGWQQTLATIHSDLVLVARRSPLSQALDDSNEWKRVYQDDSYLLFAHPDSSLPPVDNRHLPLYATFP